MKIRLRPDLIKFTKETRLYNLELPVIGLTGGIATGKSTVSKRLKELGYLIIDADQLVKSIYKDAEMITFVKNHFQSAISDNKIDFNLLRELAFSDKKNLKLLEDKIYQSMPQKFLQEFKKRRLESHKVIFYDVPLLFEKGLENLTDQSVLIYCPREIQERRISSRDGSSIKTIQAILNTQMNIEDKKLKSNFVIDNSKNFEHLESEIQKTLDTILY